MITVPTIFVLGAGASMPFGLPSGPQLKRAVIAGLAKPRRSQWASALHELAVDQREQALLSKDLAYSRRYSVDAFLADNPQFERAGKIAMAAALLARESAETLENDEIKGDWCQYVFNRTADCSLDRLHENRLSFVTFNYDRSLEEYFFRAIAAAYPCEPAEAGRIASQLEIVHVYGSLGPLPWVPGAEPGVLRYGSAAPDPLVIQAAAKGVRIMPNREDHEFVATEEFERASEAIEAAERLYFLGFGYHEANLRRLLATMDQPRFTNGHVVGTCCGMEDAELLHARRVGVGTPDRDADASCFCGHSLRSIDPNLPTQLPNEETGSCGKSTGARLFTEEVPPGWSSGRLRRSSLRPRTTACVFRDHEGRGRRTCGSNRATPSPTARERPVRAAPPPHRK